MGLKQTVTRDRELYGNCRVLSPDGHLMFRCDEKKTNWYLKRNLAEIVDDDPHTIKLNFEPKGYGNHNKDYGLHEMANICVDCGETEYLTRHHVVPYCYRRYFTVKLKSHNFHDILAMCPDCHEEYEIKAFKLKRSISEEYGAPISGTINIEGDTIMLKRMASCLLNHSKDAPVEKVNDFAVKLKERFGWKRITRQRLKNICEQKVVKHHRLHGEIVVSKLTDIGEFIKMWRQHFLDNNKCGFLPKNWSVDYE